jgi:hypothetical protein
VVRIHSPRPNFHKDLQTSQIESGSTRVHLDPALTWALDSASCCRRNLIDLSSETSMKCCASPHNSVAGFNFPAYAVIYA